MPRKQSTDPVPIRCDLPKPAQQNLLNRKAFSGASPASGKTPDTVLCPLSGGQEAVYSETQPTRSPHMENQNAP